MEYEKPAAGPSSSSREHGGPKAATLSVAVLAAAALAFGLVVSCGSTPSGSDTMDEGGAGIDQTGPEVLITPEEFTELSVASIEGSLVRFEGGVVLRPIGAGPAITLEDRSGLVLDLSGLELRGQSKGAALDSATGTAIVLRRCEDIEIRGGLIGGFKACITVEESTDIRLRDMRFDGWFGQRLRSTPYAEDQSDWLRPHKNDGNEWVTNYGAAIAVSSSQEVTIAGCRGRRGQNGILLTRVSGAKVYDCDFSFLSGWGLALYRSSDNVISHNIFDYCVRGYSHDVYWRGQDSAGILLFEQSSRNLVARNSATHCGDGVFLYAGDDLVRKGVLGSTGSNDNVFYGNDLRFAAANALEATFSKGNAVLRCNLSGAHQHGVWGGYSSELAVVGNTIDDVVGGGVTIEHGQDCVIAENSLAGNEIGVATYWDEDPEFVDGPFGRRNSTESARHWVLQNKFANNVLDIVIRGSRGLVFHGNEYVPGSREPYFEAIGAESDPTLDAGTVQRWLDALNGAFPSGNLSETTLDPWLGKDPELLRTWRSYELPADLPGSNEIRAEERDAFRGGLETIVMGEFGPWDFRSGEPRPEVRRPGGILSDITWDATWFRWVNGVSDPRTAERVWRSRAAAPILRRRLLNFVNPWGSDEVRREVGNDFFGLFASTAVTLDEAGLYDLTVVSGDGVRLYIDGELMIERWTLHAPTRDEKQVLLEAGEHIIRLEYFQIQGSASLVVELRPHR